MATLYIVGTPIGNLDDFSPRGQATLRAVQLIAAEDTRHTRKLLSRFEIHTPLTGYHEHNELERLPDILAALDAGDVALVSDGGMPGISDPGLKLVQAAVAAGHAVVAVPGPVALTTALVVSGLPTDAFVYLGFLPRKTAQRRALLADNAGDTRTLVAYEAPHRLLKTLADIQAVLGERPLAVCRELTKQYEEVFRGAASAAHAHFSSGQVRGEITLVIGGAAAGSTRWPEARVRHALQAALDEGARHKQAARDIAAQSGWATRDVYQLALDEDVAGEI